MRVYWLDRWPEPPAGVLDNESLRTLADGLLFGMRWPEQALTHYDEYLRREPRDPAAWNAMSLALAQAGRPAEALAGFRRVLALSPADPNVRRNIALLEQQVRTAPGSRQ
jgi:Flp pilus assembly protein TadD